MNNIRSLIEAIGEGVLLLLRSLRYCPDIYRARHRIIEQCVFMGNATAPLVAMLSFSIGSVLALQMGWSFKSFGVQQYLGSAVGLSMVKELGPVMTAIMVVGRIGSAVTAELASMKIYREIDALKTMNIPAERFLILPRIVAISIMMPILTIISVIAGWGGGALICESMSFINLDYRVFFRVLTDFVTMDAVTDGLIKSQVFATVTIIISCNIALRTTGGPREIGQSVTRAVVASIIAILALDYFVTNALL